MTLTTNVKQAEMTLAFVAQGAFAHPEYVNLVEQKAEESYGETELVAYLVELAHQVDKGFEAATETAEYGDAIFEYSVAVPAGVQFIQHAIEHEGQLPTQEEAWDIAYDLTRKDCRQLSA